MKKYIACILCMALLLTGCSLFSLSDESHLKMGSSVEINNIDSRFALLDNVGDLVTEGLYYASWGMGEKEVYKDEASSKSVDLYDARLYFLLGEYDNEEEAQNNMDSWLASAKENYELLNEEEITCNGQAYSLLTYNLKGGNGFYVKGVSVFGMSSSNAVCIELTGREKCKEDLREILINFLENCSFIKD